jgi:hypothetical protein
MTTLSLSPRLWIFGPKRDLSLFILPALLIIPLILVLKRVIPAETLGLYILGLGGFGHHLPGFIRAYADPALFKAHKLRFTVVPALVILLCGLYSFLDLNALVLATVAWGTWHGAMQINGFARIYDSKVSSIAPVTARLDAWMCIAWFGFAILCSPAKQFSLVTQYYLSGGLLIPPEAFGFARIAWGIGTAVVTVLFLANARRQRLRGNPANPVKFLLMGVSFAFWWYCTTWTGSLILGVLMWEIFHDVQYNALVWNFQRRRVDDGLGASGIERTLFRPGWRRLALYAILILAYGTIGVFGSFADINVPEKTLLGGQGPQWLLRITLASALLHFYYDGFIWRIRQRAIARGLNLPQGPANPAPPARAGISHGWKWALFVVPVLWLGVSQYRHHSPSFEEQVVNMSQGLPGSWISHFLAGTYYKGIGRTSEAEMQYRLVTRHNPDFPAGHLFLADMLSRRGAIAEAAAEYEQTLKLDPEDEAARRNVAFLYLSLEQPFAAAAHFQVLLSRFPDDPDVSYGLASALLQLGRFDEARARVDALLRRDPGHSGALNYRGMLHQFNGDRDSAIIYYRRALAADSGNASALQNLRALATPPRKASK